MIFESIAFNPIDKIHQGGTWYILMHPAYIPSQPYLFTMMPIQSCVIFNILPWIGESVAFTIGWPR